MTKEGTNKIFIHPYTFVLKEGKEFKQNSLDYSLLMLQVGKPEIIRNRKSPRMHPLIRSVAFD